MSTPLGEYLTQEEKIYLESLTHHDGWAVLVKILNDACRKATEEVIKIDPQSDNYERKLAAAQNTARAKNSFCVEVLKTVEWRMKEGLIMQEAEKGQKAKSAN